MKVSGWETPNSSGNVFKKSLKSEECVKLLVNCIRNFKKEVKRIHSLASSANDKQFKYKKQLSDLSEAMNFVSETFDELETDILENEKPIAALKSKVSSLNEKIKDMEK